MDREALVVGDRNEPDFRRMLSWLNNCSVVNWARSCRDAQDRVAELATIDMIMLLQSRPGEYSTAEVEQLHRLWPLARIIMVLSSWCEGESRSGKPCPGVWRIYWYDLERRLGPILSGSHPVTTKAWCLPRSASDGERLLADLSLEPEQRKGTVLIHANIHVMYESIADACSTMGYATRWHRSGSSSIPHEIAAGIWDADRGDEDEWRQIDSFAQAIHASLLVLQGFPREDQSTLASSMGVTLLAKPFQLPDLWRALEATGTIKHEVN